MGIGNRFFSIDMLRAFACISVVFVHVCYRLMSIPSTNSDDVFWLGIIAAFGRSSVPLFVMISGFLLLPLSKGIKDFFKRKARPILYPFLIWSMIYAFYPFSFRDISIQHIAYSIFSIFINYKAFHLWYIYMLVGLYLLIPILSPWLKQCTKSELKFYLLVWAATTFIPYIRILFPSILGEATWNDFHILYYFSGFSGYLVLGYYIKRYGALSIRNSVAILLIGYIATLIGYIIGPSIKDQPIALKLCTINVALMSMGIFSLFVNYKKMAYGILGSLITSISANSYNIYLSHVLVLWLLFPFFISQSVSIFVILASLTISVSFFSYIISIVISTLQGALHISQIFTKLKHTTKSFLPDNLCKHK